MKLRIAAATTAIVLGLAAPVTSASAFESFPHRGGDARYLVDRDDLATGSLGTRDALPAQDWCAPSPAAEGNANLQARPVKNYGTTSGGYACR